MIRSLTVALALAVSGPVLAQAAPAAPAKTVSAEKGAAEKGAARANLAQTGTSDPARLAAAERVVVALVPPGIYMRMMREKFPAMMDAMMSKRMGMRPADLGGPSGKSIADADPQFRERMSIMTRVVGDEFGKVFDRLEPRVRVGLSRAFARKFTTVQLDELDAFFATPTGKAFAGEYLATFMDPEVMQEMTVATPELIEAVPAIMAKVEKATAHLPPPPKPDASHD